MLKLWGGLLVLSGCILPVLGQIREKEGQIRFMEGMSAALEDLRRTLLVSGAGMDTLLRRGRASGQPEVRRFFSAIRLEELENRSLSEQWAAAAHELLSLEEPKRILTEAGRSLGRCPLDEQCQVLRHTADELEAIAQRERRSLREQKRLWLTVSASVGTLMVILLL